MQATNLKAAERGDFDTTCPSCGGNDFEENLIPEQLYIEAAKEVPYLLFEGQVDEAIKVLSHLYAIRIVNIVSPRWRCACGVSFYD